LADGSSDVAFVWLPLPEDDRYARLVMAAEPRHVAFPDRHPLAAKHEVRIADLVDEPFLALPESAGPLRDFWLALDARSDGDVRIGAVVNNPDETYEALVDGRGVCLVAAGNAPLLTRGDVVTRPVVDIAPCHLALAWRGDDTRPLVRGYVRAATQFLERARVNAASGDGTGAAAESAARTGAAAGSGVRRGGAAGSGDRTGAAAESAVRARAAVESAGGD
jgi:DNA-binding transcriptional LysR family regulator